MNLQSALGRRDSCMGIGYGHVEWVQLRRAGPYVVSDLNSVFTQYRNFVQDHKDFWQHKFSQIEPKVLLPCLPNTYSPATRTDDIEPSAVCSEYARG